MKLLAAILLVACEQPPREVPIVRRPSKPRDPTPAEMDAMKDFVRVVDPSVDVPIGALQPWLIAGSYRAWPHESMQHVSSGPHAETVVTYLSPSLVASLRDKAKAHPQGAASVKELFKHGEHVGWAVGVKTAADSANGKTWYWYEILSTAPTAKPKSRYAGLGVELCRDCHAENGGVDQVLTEFPLR